MASITKRLVISIAVCFIILPFINRAYATTNDTLLIELGIREINWSYSGQENGIINVGLDVRVSYFGISPPKSIFLSSTLESTSADQSSATVFDLTQVFGPWILTGNNQWVLNLTRDSQNLGHLPDFPFTFNKDQTWPNERLNTTILSAFSLRTISGEIDSQINPHITSVNDHPEEHNYYWLWVNTLSINTSGFKASGINMADEPNGCFFSLVLSHELTVAGSFNYVPLLLNIVYPVLTVVLFCAVFVSTLKYFKSILSTILVIDSAMIALLLTIDYEINTYIPVWENSIYSAFLGTLVWLIVLLFITIVVGLIGKTNFLKFYSFVAIKLQPFRIVIECKVTSLKSKISIKKIKEKGQERRL